MEKLPVNLAPAHEQCALCHRTLSDGVAFKLGGELRCWRCALAHRPLLRRSATASLVVGTLLVAVNQLPTLLSGSVSPRMLWQIPLTYAVPFCVATWGALSNTQR